MILHNHALFKRRAAPFERKKDRKTAFSGPSSGRSASPASGRAPTSFPAPPKESPSPAEAQKSPRTKKLRRPTKRMSGSGAETTAQADSKSAGRNQERQQLPSRPQAPAETPVMEAPEASAAAILASTSSKGA